MDALALKGVDGCFLRSWRIVDQNAMLRLYPQRLNFEEMAHTEAKKAENLLKLTYFNSSSLPIRCHVWVFPRRVMRTYPVNFITFPASAISN